MRNNETLSSSTNKRQEEMIRPEYFDDYLEEGYEKYADYLKSYADKISEKELKEIDYMLDNFGYERGLEMAAECISNALYIDKPKIKFQVIKEDKNGIRYGCDRRDNSIVIRRMPEEKYEDVLTISDGVEMIAHELWHAHQHEDIKNNSERARLYKQDYIQAKDDLEGYFRQPVELKAYVFGEMIRNKFSKRRKETLTRELNKAIGAIAECMTNGNEHLVSFFMEDRDYISRKLRELSNEEDARIGNDKRRRFNYIHE